MENKRYNNIIIDGHNLYWRSFYSNATEYIEDPGEDSIYSGGIQQFIDRVKQLKYEFGYDNTTIYFLFDNALSVHNVRQFIDDQYKTHRKENQFTKEIYRTIRYLIELLRNYFDNSFIFRIDNNEADDLVPLVLKKVTGKTLVISADLDWSRNIGPDVDWFNYKKVYTPVVFEDEYKFSPTLNKVKLYKSIRGDKSDNIPAGLPHLPENIMLYIIEKYGEEDNFNLLIRKLSQDSGISEHWRLAVKENENRLLKNNTLLNFVELSDDADDYIQICKRNKTMARIWFKILDIPLESWLSVERQEDFLAPKGYKKVKTKRNI